MPAEPEKLDALIKFYATDALRARIKAEVKPGRNMSDVIRDALELYFSTVPKSQAQKLDKQPQPRDGEKQ